MNPIRILHVVTKMDAGGIETLLMNFYRNIDREKVQFDFLTHRDEEGFYDDEIKNLGGRIYHVPPINPLKQKKYVKALDDFFLNHKEYRIVHSHINTYSMYPLRAAKKANIPVRIAHSHSADVPLDFKTPFRMYTKMNLKKYSTHNFACSINAGVWLYGRKAIKKKNFKVINNAINSSKYAYDQSTEYKISDQLDLNDDFVIGHIGSFIKQKNHLFLIDIFKEIVQREPNTKLVLIGEGELQNKVSEKIKQYNLNNHVIFTGVRKDVNELLQAMDAFVLPSLYEGLGIVAIEAQAAGVPTIVSEKVPDEAYITELIKQQSLQQNAVEWADKILTFKGYQKTDTSTEIESAGFDIVEQTDKLQEFYVEVYATNYK